MDSITQAVLGAGISGAIMGKVHGRKAILYGALLGTLPDLDILHTYPDPVSTMTFHRGYSHSVFVLTAFAGVLTAGVRRFFPSTEYSALRLFLALWLTLVTHPILDSFTSYGTQLFWPLALEPESWSSIFIIDPIYTLPMLFAVIIALIVGLGPRTIKALGATVLFGAAYLAFSVAGKFMAESRVHDALNAQGVTIASTFSTPMPLNTLLWRVVVKTPDGQYYDAVSGMFDSAPPEMLVQSLNLPLRKTLADSDLHARLQWFTGDWLRYDVIDNDLVVTDLRMGLPGFHTFRFVMAHRDNEASPWQAVLPSSWPRDRGGMDELKVIFARIVSQSPPLPLAEWAKNDTAPK